MTMFMVAAVEHRFGRVNRLPATIERLSDKGSSYIAAIRVDSLATSSRSKNDTHRKSAEQWNA